MPESSRIPSDQLQAFDLIALDLRDLRERAGHVSYAELVRRITVLRLDRGVREAAATPARSTVYNAFRTGRVRLDTELVRDIVLALGETSDEADLWVERCSAARSRVDAERAQRHENAPEILPESREAPRTSGGLIAALLLACVAANLIGLHMTGVFRLSVYLDMVGTAVAALALGPWHGVAVAVTSSALGFVTGDPNTVSFTPVNVIGALVWGYGLRRFGMGTDLPRFVCLNLLTAVACTIVAAPIVSMLFHGGDGHASEQAVLSLEAMHVPFAVSVFVANIVTSVADKLLVGFIALVAFVMLHGRLGLSAAHMPLVEKLGALRAAGSPRAELGAANFRLS